MTASASTLQNEGHTVERVGWLRAAVLGANDGILSTASIIVGVASASADRGHVLLAGIAGLAAGAMSMASGEYVSVSSQRDAETADLAREEEELRTDPRSEERELAMIYVRRGLDLPLATQVARQMMSKDALGAHARDELGINERSRANPVQAALASAGSFASGAALPLLTALAVPAGSIAIAVVIVTLIALGVLGALGAYAGGAPWRTAAIRVLFWGALAMAVTAAVGRIAGQAV